MRLPTIEPRDDTAGFLAVRLAVGLLGTVVVIAATFFL